MRSLCWRGLLLRARCIILENDLRAFTRTFCAVCSENSGLSGRYHAGLWSGKRWSCCRLSTRSAEGCDTCSSWSTKPTANTTNPSLTTTSASTTLISMSGGTVNNSIITSDHRSQSTQNAEANNNPIVQPQSRSTIGSYSTYVSHAFTVAFCNVIIGPLANRYPSHCDVKRGNISIMIV